MNKTDAIRLIVTQCPDIGVLGDLVGGVELDWTADQPDSYGLMVYGDGEVKEQRWIDGGGVDVIKFNAALFIRLHDETQYNRAENCGFLEKFAKYVRKLNSKEAFPTLDEGKVTKLETAAGELYGHDESGGAGLYAIQINMTYETPVNRTPKGHSVFYNAE